MFKTIEISIHFFAGSRGDIQLDDCSLHEKVDAEVFETACQLNIIPPDGEVVSLLLVCLCR